ncbi:hypothetical protein B0H16DRAFT_1478347 [Mycena metata]|uniref:Uncharacterized protein n=1 Tax=Mycena metata TaxID=1033252 RepID=A0AAD7MFA8_9AGAR|nr:hypothetical protein B0H16DRAFT_1478347 [Mycena metata]
MLSYGEILVGAHKNILVPYQSARAHKFLFLFVIPAAQRLSSAALCIVLHKFSLEHSSGTCRLWNLIDELLVTEVDELVRVSLKCKDYHSWRLSDYKCQVGASPAQALILMVRESGTGFNNVLNLTVNSVAPPSSFTAALLVGLLWVLQNSNPNTELVICTSTDYLTKAFVVNRSFHENDMLDANFGLGRAVLGALNERCGRVRFKKVLQNPALTLKSQAAQTALLDTDIDMMFNCPVILISNGTQRLFTKIINSLKPSPCRKTTEINLDRIRCCVQEASGYLPTDKAIWTSIRYEDSLPDDWIRSDRVLVDIRPIYSKLGIGKISHGSTWACSRKG